MQAGSPDRVGRRLAAILAADVVGYSWLMEADESGTARLLREHRAAADPLVAEHGGRIVKTTGDGVLIEFPLVASAMLHGLHRDRQGHQPRRPPLPRSQGRADPDHARHHRRPAAMMGFVLRTAGLGLALALGVGAAHAGALIEFANVSDQAQPARLLGYLARPDGVAPFPGVVVLHGCNGFFGGYVEIADQLKSWGFVALLGDSFGPREISTRCGMGLPAQAADAYAALKYLSQDASVDAARIAVLGYSMGGESALTTVERGPMDPPFPEKFAAAVVYYPSCRGRSAVVNAPTLILVGAEDNRAPAAACREMVAQPHEGGAAIDLIVYAGAHHNFNFRVLTGPRSPGYWLEYNEAAAQDAEAKMRAFLAVHLGGTSSDQPTAK